MDNEQVGVELLASDEQVTALLRRTMALIFEKGNPLVVHDFRPVLSGDNLYMVKVGDHREVVIKKFIGRKDEVTGLLDMGEVVIDYMGTPEGGHYVSTGWGRGAMEPDALGLPVTVYEELMKALPDPDISSNPELRELLYFTEFASQQVGSEV